MHTLDNQLANAIDAVLRRGPKSHQELALALGTDVVTVNTIVTSRPRRFTKMRVADAGPRQQRRTLISRRSN